MTNNVNKMLKDINFISEAKRQRAIEEYQEKKRRAQLIKDKIQSRLVCKVPKW